MVQLASSPHYGDRHRGSGDRHSRECTHEQCARRGKDARGRVRDSTARHASEFAQTPRDQEVANQILGLLREKSKEMRAEKWGILGLIGINQWLLPIDDACRSRFSPYGFSGIMLGAAIIFFA